MRESYMTPDVVEESTFEVQARACQKVPGLSAVDFCGQVWLGKSGQCELNPNAKSS